MDTITSENKKNVNIYMEANPNPNSLKFVANFVLVDMGETYDFPDLASTESAPLAKAIFQDFKYVTRVFYMSNFVTVTKTDDVLWEEVRNELKDYIQTYLEKDLPVLTKSESDAPEAYKGDDETILKIIEILDEYIKPAVEQDGGAISFHSYEDGIVKVLLQGACSGCPSSTVTLKAGIESLLKRALPEIQAVEAVEM